MQDNKPANHISAHSFIPKMSNNQYMTKASIRARVDSMNIVFLFKRFQYCSFFLIKISFG
jgi:hypothetical protein